MTSGHGISDGNGRATAIPSRTTAAITTASDHHAVRVGREHQRHADAGGADHGRERGDYAREYLA